MAKERTAAQKLGFGCLVVIAIFAGLVAVLLIGLITGVIKAPEDTSPRRPTQTESAPAAPSYRDVTAVELVNDYVANEVAADDKWKDSKVAASGQVDSIGKDISGNPYVTLRSEDPLRKVQASFSKENESALISLSKGDSVLVMCTVKGLMMNVQLGDCRLVK